MENKKNTLQTAKELVNRYTKNLPKKRKKLLELAKEELRILFGK